MAVNENRQWPNAEWLFAHLEPFLRRMERQKAYDALCECVERGYMTRQQLNHFTAVWARTHGKKCGGTGDAA